MCLTLLPSCPTRTPAVKTHCLFSSFNSKKNVLRQEQYGKCHTVILQFFVCSHKGQHAINYCAKCIFSLPLCILIFNVFYYSFFIVPLFALFLTKQMHGFLPLFFIIPQMRPSLIHPTMRDTSFSIWPFLIAYLRVLKLTSLIGKLKIWCKCTFRGCPITTNKPLVNQIALRERQRVSGQLSLPFQHLCVLPYFAIRCLTQPFLSQSFYCICCPRQTAIKRG